MTRINLFALRLFFATLLLGVCSYVSAQIKVVDSESGVPVSYASVFDDATGKMLGITTSEGAIPSKAGSCKTISVQHLNFNPATVEVASIQGDTIRLTPREAFQVKEISVGKEKHDYARIKFYVRQYSIINGQIAAVGESIKYGFYDTKKKLEKELTESQCILRNDDAFKGQKKLVQQMGELSGSLPGGNIARTINHFAAYDDGKRHYSYYKGKKFQTVFVRHDDKAQRMEFVQDSILVERPFNFWIFGISVSDIYKSSTFSSAYRKASLSTWQSTVESMRVTHNKTQTNIDWYAETYPLCIDYADKADYKALRKELESKKSKGTMAAFVRPEGFPPFNKYVTEAMTHMKKVKD